MALTLSDGLGSGAKTSLTGITVTATFSSAVTDVTIEDFVVLGATKGGLGAESATVYTFPLTLGDQAAVTINCAADISTPGNMIATQVTLTYGTKKLLFYA